MPTLSINTNISAISIPKGFAKAASELVAKLTGKPESYVMVWFVFSFNF
jgi:phenylpyruvate tautomerase PptA (4-oxalocrotonate tautomerase family)